MKVDFTDEHGDSGHCKGFYWLVVPVNILQAFWFVPELLLLAGEPQPALIITVYE